MSLFHTKIGAALADGSTWAGCAAAVTAAALLPYPFNWLVAVVACIGMVLKGGGADARPLS